MPEQLKKVQDFQSQLGDFGSLWWKFNTAVDFEQFVRIHLSKHIAAFGKTWERALASRSPKMNLRKFRSNSRLLSVASSRTTTRYLTLMTPVHRSSV